MAKLKCDGCGKEMSRPFGSAHNHEDCASHGWWRLITPEPAPATAPPAERRRLTDREREEGEWKIRWGLYMDSTKSWAVYTNGKRAWSGRPGNLVVEPGQRDRFYWWRRKPRPAAAAPPVKAPEPPPAIKVGDRVLITAKAEWVVISVESQGVWVGTPGVNGQGVWVPRSWVHRIPADTPPGWCGAHCDAGLARFNCDRPLGHLGPHSWQR